MIWTEGHSVTAHFLGNWNAPGRLVTGLFNAPLNNFRQQVTGVENQSQNVGELCVDQIPLNVVPVKGARVTFVVHFWCKFPVYFQEKHVHKTKLVVTCNTLRHATQNCTVYSIFDREIANSDYLFFKGIVRAKQISRKHRKFFIIII